MNSSEAQSDSGPNQTYFDPEEMDSSEQYFSASLEHDGGKPAFVPDTHQDTSEVHAISYDNTGEVGGRASRPSGADSSLSDSASVSSNAPEGVAASSEAPPSASDWRNLVSAKVKHYKTVKPRKERYPSLQLPFDSRPAWKPEPTVRAVMESEVFSPYSDASPVAGEDHLPAPIPITTEATARVLEFPRPGMLPFNRDELAEPVIDRPRIIEAPELLPPPPALGGILIGPELAPEPERQPGFDMPLTTAGLSRKVFAAAVDGVLVGAALGIFGYMFLRFNASLPPLRVAVGIAAALLGILWFAYQWAFIVVCGTTLGLRAARLTIMRFDGTRAPRKLRRWRVVTSVLSCAPLGLGYAWCFFDEDQLTWHDRITKTHLAPK